VCETEIGDFIAVDFSNNTIDDAPGDFVADD